MEATLKIIRSDTTQQIFVGVVTIAAGIAGLIFALWVTGNTQQKPPQIPTGTTTTAVVQPSQYPDYDALQSLKSIALVQNSATFKNNRVGDVVKTIKVAGKFSRMYLQVQASVNGKPLTDFDSLYVAFNYQGGHLFRPQTLPVPLDETKTVVLFNTSVIPYLANLPYSASRTPSTTDWFDNVFNKSDGKTTDINFNAFLSTTQQGEVYLIALYYSCDSTTPDCSIQ